MSQSTLIKTILRLSSAVLALTTILVFSLESMALNLLFLLLIFWTLALSAFTAYKLSRRVFWLWPLLGVGLGFVLVNVLMARVEDRFWARFVYDETLGWKPTAGLHREPFEISGGTYLVTTDAYGYRNPPLQPGARVAFLLQGDSNGFGFGVADHEHACARLQALTQQSCYNAAVPGYDVNQYILQLGSLPVQYDTRILFFNMENDFTLSMLATPYLIRRPYFLVERGTMRVVRNRMPLIKQIYGYRFIESYTQWNRDLAPFEQGNAWGNLVPNWFAYFPAIQHKVVRNKSAIEAIAAKIAAAVQPAPPDWQQFPNQPDWLLLHREKWPEPYRSYTADFTHLLSTYLHQGQKTIVVLWPFRKQIIPSEHAAALARLQASGHAEQDHHPRALNVFIAGIAREAGALVVDATDTFASDARPQHFYLPGDSHLSADGHARLAELLAQAVTDQARN